LSIEYRYILKIYYLPKSKNEKGENMKNLIEYDSDSEAVRQKLISHISENGILQTWIAKKCDLSTCSISLFINGKRLLVEPKMAILKKIINF